MKRCLNCEFWKGDKEYQKSHIKKHGKICMDKHNGWSIEGACPEIKYELEIECYGDHWGGGGVDTVFTPSWFSCALYEKEK